MHSTTAFSQINRKFRAAFLPYLFIIALACLFNVNAAAQENKPFSVTLLGQANFGLYDETLTNNSFGLGAGLNMTYKMTNKVEALAELNADLFAGTKVLKIHSDGRIYEAKSGMVSIYAGPQFLLGNRFFASTTAGASFFNSNTHFGVRPSLGYHFSPNGRWMMKTSFTHIFNAEAISGNPFGYLSVALGFRF